MHFSETHRVFPRRGNTAVVTCPHCGISQTVQVDRLAAHKGPLKVRCSCGPIFGILFELRKTWRKKVHFHGRYRTDGSTKQSGPVIVHNISKKGVGFTVPAGHEIHKGDRLTVAFTLDDDARTVIEKDVVVKFANIRDVGCEYTDTHSEDERLGDYFEHKP